MHKPKHKLALVAAFIAALLAAPTLQARDANAPSDSKGGMMGGGNMTGRMSRMMDHCGSMMQGGSRNDRPNDQWRKDAPAKPDRDK